MARREDVGSEEQVAKTEQHVCKICEKEFRDARDLRRHVGSGVSCNMNNYMA